ncbi:O-antigen ligase family protein [Carnobacteriaceae bacterium zg-ZUI240]|nr:O-antigen ligase family protein [Carnobacteriaceae bacterium zg-ZUI240]
MIHIIVVLSLLLPIPMPIIAIAIGVGYGLIKYFRIILKHLFTHKMILALFGIGTIGSLLSQNTAGLIVVMLLFGLWIYFITLSQEMTSFLFEGATSVLLIASWFHAGYALLQHLKIFFGPDYHAWHESMISWRDGRADSVFLNPNYYAFMCVVYILIALYKAQTSQAKVRYYLTILVNMLGIVFTQSRTAFAVIFIVIFTFYYCALPHSQRKWLRIGAIGTLAISPLFQLLPRFDYGTIVAHLVDIRFEIWQVSLHAFLKRAFFGYGPFAYRMLHTAYGSYPTQHAHNLYIDSLLNYGIVGVILLICVLVWLIKRMMPLRTTHTPLFALGMSCIVLILTHGLLDVSILFVHTLSVMGFLFIYMLKKEAH